VSARQPHWPDNARASLNLNMVVHLACTVARFQVNRLEAFLQHYKSLGVDQFWMTIHSPASDAEDDGGQLSTELSKYAADQTIHFSTLTGVFDAMLVRKHHDTLQADAFIPSDWVLWADVDEFQIYPDDLRCTLARADRMGAMHISGELVDRVARNGILAPLDPHQSIWEQFPVGCALTLQVLKGYSHKVVAAKGAVRLTPGNHEVLPGLGPTRWAPELAAIHHFKWDETVVARLSSRLEPAWKAKCSWWPESERFLNFIHDRRELDLSSLLTFDFGKGNHRIDDAAAWHFVHCLRCSNPEWPKRWGMAEAETE
jgi:hypothetical protein